MHRGEIWVKDDRDAYVLVTSDHLSETRPPITWGIPLTAQFQSWSSLAQKAGLCGSIHLRSVSRITAVVGDGEIEDFARDHQTERGSLPALGVEQVAHRELV